MNKKFLGYVGLVLAIILLLGLATQFSSFMTCEERASKSEGSNYCTSCFCSDSGQMTCNQDPQCASQISDEEEQISVEKLEEPNPYGCALDISCTEFVPVENVSEGVFYNKVCTREYIGSIGCIQKIITSEDKIVCNEGYSLVNEVCEQNTEPIVEAEDNNLQESENWFIKAWKKILGWFYK